VGLERDAVDAAESGDLLDRDEVEAQLAKLHRAPGESPRDFAERVDATRDRIWSNELLVQSKLDELYGSGTYPAGYQIDALVAQERQMVEQMPPEDGAERLRIVLEVFEPHRPAPTFEEKAPEDGGGDPPSDL